MQFGSDVAIQILPAQEGTLVLRHAHTSPDDGGSGFSDRRARHQAHGDSSVRGGTDTTTATSDRAARLRQ